MATKSSMSSTVRKSGVRIASALVSVIALAPLSADADWPMARHDPQRTGGSPGSSNITSPAPFWRAYLGGHLNPEEFVAYDVDGDHAPDYVYLEGGKLFARRPTGEIVWATPTMGLTYLFGVADFNGDGSAEVVAASSDHVFLFKSADGSLVWSEPDGEVVYLSGVRFTDLNGDGRPDLLIKECSCCGLLNDGAELYARSFAGGFGASKLLWTTDPVGCGAPALTVFRNAARQALVVEASDDSLKLLDPTTGAVAASTPGLGLRLNYSTCLPLDLDNVPGDELLCTQNVNQGPGFGARRVFALAYDGAGPTLSVAWQRNIGDYDDGDLFAPPNMALDLDGDGKREVVIAGKSSADVWTTYILDAKTGAPSTSLAGQKVEAVFPAQGTMAPLVITSANGQLSGWSFVATSMPPTTRRWMLPGATTIGTWDWNLASVSGSGSGLLAADANGDRILDLLTSSSGGSLSAFDLSVGAPRMAGSYQLPAATSLLAGWPAQSTTSAEAVVMRDDGQLVRLGSGLVPVRPPNGQDEGIRIGGYYSGKYGFGPTPIAGAATSSPAQSVFTVDSRHALLRLDANVASMAVPPQAKWSTTHTTDPVFVPQLVSGRPAIVSSRVATGESSYIVALDVDGGEIWRSPTAGTPAFDVLPGKLDSDGILDFFVQDRSGVVLTTRGLSGRTGATLWVSPGVSLNWGLQPMAAADWNGDGRTDVLTVPNNLVVLSGSNGAKLAENTDFLAYFVPIVRDLDGDGTDEVTLQGGYFPVRAFQHDLTPLWVSTSDDKPYPLGAVVQCAGGPVLLEGSFAFPARLSIVQLAPPASGSKTTMVLAGGRKFADEASAIAAGAYLGQLGDVTVEADLSGLGRPSALVGSGDGFLYAMNPCGGSLDWAYDLHTPVGSAVFADTDGDGKDEILVTAADGYLYGLKNKAIDTPSFVWDIDPNSGITDRDIDDVTTVDTLWGKWGAVAGATGYEVAVVRAGGGGYVTTPPWRNVGNVTEASVSGLSLADSAKYQFAVRALTVTAASPDSVSDGVTVHRIPDGGVPEGGTDASDGGDARDGSDGGEAEASDAARDAAADDVSDARVVDVPDSRVADAGLKDVSTLPDSTEGGGCDCTVGQGRGEHRAGLVWMVALWLAGACRRRSSIGRRARG
jgi:hypothetical protein